MSRTYISAGKTVEVVLKQKRSFKATIANKAVVGREEYLLAVQAIKYKIAIDKLLQKCNISAAILDVNEGLMYVMVYELIFGKGKING